MNTVPLSIEFLMGKPAFLLHRNFGKLITTKADPEIYRMVADRIGLPTGEVLFLDDNLNAVSTAVKSGMKVGGVYDKSSENFTNEIKSAADYYINDFSELLLI